MIDDNESAERIHVDLMENFLVTGPDGEEWYTVSTRRATSSDFDLMLKFKPDFKPMLISDETLGTWRSWVRRKEQEAE